MDIHTKHIRDALQRIEIGLSVTVLSLRYRLPRDIELFRQCLLRKAVLLAQLSDMAADRVHRSLLP